MLRDATALPKPKPADGALDAVEAAVADAVKKAAAVGEWAVVVSIGEDAARYEPNRRMRSSPEAALLDV